MVGDFEKQVNFLINKLKNSGIAIELSGVPGRVCDAAARDNTFPWTCLCCTLLPDYQACLENDENRSLHNFLIKSYFGAFYSLVMPVLAKRQPTSYYFQGSVSPMSECKCPQTFCRCPNCCMFGTSVVNHLVQFLKVFTFQHVSFWPVQQSQHSQRGIVKNFRVYDIRVYKARNNTPSLLRYHLLKYHIL